MTDITHIMRLADEYANKKVDWINGFAKPSAVVIARKALEDAIRARSNT